MPRLPMAGINGRRAFTLVEVLIVVVILSILATMVVPLFASASSDATKAALRRQLQSIDHQIEIYKVNNQGRLPSQDPDEPIGGATNNGWGIMVSALYFKAPPFNSYTGQSLIVAGDAATAAAELAPSDNGWYYEESATGTQLFVYAAGFDKTTDLLANEQP